MTEFGLKNKNMIKNIIKFGFLFFFMVLYTFNSTYAQSKFGKDSLSCLENRAIYYQSYQQKNYEDALKPWRWAFINCPQSSENIFRNGPKIIKARMKLDVENKSSYIDTLMMIFDQRIQYFGKEGYVLGLKGYELVIADPNRSEEARNILLQSIEKQGNKSGPQAVYGYIKSIVNLEKLGLRSEADVLEAYSYIDPIIQYNIANKSKNTKYFIQYSEKIEKLFSDYANCNDLISLFSKKFDSSAEDLDFLNRAVKLLDNKDCTSSELFFKVSSKLYELDPSASAADKMSKMSIARGKYSNAINFAKEAVDLEAEQNQKAIYHLSLADAYRNAGSYVSARNEVYKALDIRKGWGEAYMNLGNIYIAGAKECAGDFEKSTVYWVAVDAFRRALSDEDTKQRASRSINTYSKYFPNKETCFFNGIEDGKSHVVGCWINQSTIVRTSD
tara:strand:+ start:890 stop:2221 length:1332 start_codon:yes stop_codon:yes gene_type:complete